MIGFRSSSNNNPGLPSTESSNSGTLVGIEMNGTAKDSKMKSSNSRNSDPKVNLSLKPSPNTSHTETLSSKRCGKPQAEDVWACEQQSVPASSSLTMVGPDTSYYRHFQTIFRLVGLSNRHVQTCQILSQTFQTCQIVF